MSSYLTQEIQKARDHIKSSLDKSGLASQLDTSRIDKLEMTVSSLIQKIADLELQVQKIKDLDQKILSSTGAVSQEKADSDDDLFGSDGDKPEPSHAPPVAKVIAKAAPVPKSNVVLDIKPLGDDTDMKELEQLVRGIQADGLLWGQSKLVPIAYGVKKLQISCVIEDDKINTDFLEESLERLEDHVQSMDIVSFNKI